MQRRLRLRARGDGQLGVLRQPDAGARAREVVDRLRAGEAVAPTRGASKVCTFKEVSRVLAGFDDGRADEGVGAGPAQRLRGTAAGPAQKGWTAPAAAGVGGHRPRPSDAQGGLTRWPPRSTPVLSRVLGRPQVLDAARPTSATAATTRCARRSPWPRPTSSTLVKDSGLRGRGGAGFPTGLKWSFLPKPDGGPRYLVVNADESEPGTCKDIPLMMATPQFLIEGVIITSYAIGCHKAFIYVRGEVVHVYRRLLAAVEEARAEGYLGENILGSGFDLDIVVHAGAGAYICGEETALLDSLEGRRGQPRLKPPFPAVAGLYARPTVVNNVESIASVPSIVSERRRLVQEHGHRALGRASASSRSRATSPGPASTRPRSASRCASCSTWPAASAAATQLKFWTPGGSSTPLFTDEHLDTPLDFESVGAAGSMLGTRALQIFDETTCVVRAVLRWTEFYKHESCGKCTPCREGTYWLVQVLRRLEDGQRHRGRPRQAARHLRQHPRPVVLRARRRRDEPDHVVHQVLPRRVRRATSPRAAARSTRCASTLFAGANA